MLIFRKSNCIVTTSGIVTSSHSMHRLRADCIPLSTGALNSGLRKVTVPRQGLQCTIYYYRINKLCIKLVIETSLHYDARSERHQILQLECVLTATIKYFICYGWTYTLSHNIHTFHYTVNLLWLDIHFVT